MFYFASPLFFPLSSLKKGTHFFFKGVDRMDHTLGFPSTFSTKKKKCCKLLLKYFEESQIYVGYINEALFISDKLY